MADTFNDWDAVSGGVAEPRPAEPPVPPETPSLAKLAADAADHPRAIRSAVVDVMDHPYRQGGLRTLSPNLIDEARDDTAKQASSILLTFVVTAVFCFISLLSPDSALLAGSEKINVPFAGPVSFFGFMMLGPVVLIMLRVYLQIYVEHSDRLDRLARRMPVLRAPKLVPLKNPLIRGFSLFAFYLLLPLAMLLFAWKAAVFPAWGSGLLCVAAGVIASHAMLPLRRLSWRSRAFLSVSVAILAGAMTLGFGSPRRPFDLHRANLSGQFLTGDDLRGANLRFAHLDHVDLKSADLTGADLSGSNLTDADLSEAHLDHADLTGVHMWMEKLEAACGTDVKLPRGFEKTGVKLKPCPLR